MTIKIKISSESAVIAVGEGSSEPWKPTISFDYIEIAAVSDYDRYYTALVDVAKGHALNFVQIALGLKKNETVLDVVVLVKENASKRA